MSDTVAAGSLTAERKMSHPGHVLALVGAVLAIATLFLPWLVFEANNSPFLSLNGLEVASSSAITIADGGLLFRGAPHPYLIVVIAVAVLLITGYAFRRGRVTARDGLVLVGLALFAGIALWLQVNGARRIAEGLNVTLHARYGLVVVYGAFLLWVLAGVLHLRSAAMHSPSLRGTLGAWGFLSPATTLILVFYVAPVVILLVLSMTNLASSNFSEPWQYVGLDNFARMFSDRFFPKILGNTIRYVALTLTFNVGLALILALLTSYINRRVGFFFRLLWLLPRITPVVVYIVIWRRFVQTPPYGIINQFLGWMGIQHQPYWLTEAPWLFVVLVNGFIGASFGMIIFSSAIEAIPDDIVVAAKVDGASTWHVIRDITLPLLKWPLLFVTTYQTLSLLVSFEYILLLTNGGPGLYTTEVWSLTAYKRALSTYFGSNQWGYGAAWAFVLVVIGAVLAYIYLRVFRFDDLIQEPKIDIL